MVFLLHVGRLTLATSDSLAVSGFCVKPPFYRAGRSGLFSPLTQGYIRNRLTKLLPTYEVFSGVMKTTVSDV